jgi:hypothetical protein
MRRRCLRLRCFFGALCLCWCTSAASYFIGLSPAAGTHFIGSGFTVDIVVTGLETAGQILSTYDVTVGFDGSRLQFGRHADPRHAGIRRGRPRHLAARGTAVPPSDPCVNRSSTVQHFPAEARNGRSTTDDRQIGDCITLSARNSSACGIVRPSAFAVLRLLVNANLVGCSIGRSPGLAPFNILST